MEKFCVLKEVLEITGLRKSTLYRYMAQEQFPRPLKLPSARHLKRRCWLDRDNDHGMDESARGWSCRKSVT